MIVQQRPPLHLTYCLNIHPGESWAENFAALREKTLAVKQTGGAGRLVWRRACASRTRRPRS